MLEFNTGNHSFLPVLNPKLRLYIYSIYIYLDWSIRREKRYVMTVHLSIILKTKVTNNKQYF